MTCENVCVVVGVCMFVCVYEERGFVRVNFMLKSVCVCVCVCVCAF